MNAEATTRQDLPVEMTTALKSTSLTVETTNTTVTKVHEDGASSAANKMNTCKVYIMQGLSIPFACIGSGDPVRVLRLYTTNTLDTL